MREILDRLQGMSFKDICRTASGGYGKHKRDEFERDMGALIAFADRSLEVETKRKSFSSVQREIP